jgi:hypothetical protein
MKNIRQRIHAVMEDLQGVELVKTQGLKFKIIQHDDVTSALRPLYLKHGIDQEVSVMESKQLEGGTTELKVKIVWVNIDDPTDSKAVFSYGHATSHADKQTGHLRRDDLGVGKALSYAVKMAQLKNFALLSGDSDLETESAKDSKPVEMVPAAEVERVMNLLAAALTPQAFKLAAEEAALISGRITPEQTRVMGHAWTAAKARVSAPVEQQSAPLPESLGGASAPDASGEAALLALAYSRVRTRAEFSQVRKDVSGMYSKLNPAQKEWLKEKDTAAEKLLLAQEEAAR